MIFMNLSQQKTCPSHFLLNPQWCSANCIWVFARWWDSRSRQARSPICRRSKTCRVAGRAAHWSQPKICRWQKVGRMAVWRRHTVGQQRWRTWWQKWPWERRNAFCLVWFFLEILCGLLLWVWFLCVQSGMGMPEDGGCEFYLMSEVLHRAAYIRNRKIYAAAGILSQMN